MIQGDNVPDGFNLMALDGGYFVHQTPFYARLDAGVPLMGFRVDECHTNPMGVCHGGVIAALADMQVLGAQEVAGIHDRFAPTVSLSVDYIRSAKKGSWVEMRIELLRAARTLIFTQANITADGELIARSNGIFKISKAPDLKRNLEARLFR
jgi:uncharacterized protein (TIGR00369 family)